MTCQQIGQQHRYLGIYAEAIRRAFDPKGPVAMNSTAYTTTYGSAARVGNSVYGNSTSSTYGGGSVMVYDTLTLRSMDITSSIEKRQTELRHLYQRQGSCSSDELRPSSQNLSEQKRLLEGKQRHYDSQKTVIDGNIRQAQAEKETTAEIQRRKRSYDQFLNEIQQEIDQTKTKYENSLKEHQSNHQKAETEAMAKRKWFEENTITVLK